MRSAFTETMTLHVAGHQPRKLVDTDQVSSWAIAARYLDTPFLVDITVYEPSIAAVVLRVRGSREILAHISISQVDVAHMDVLPSLTSESKLYWADVQPLDQAGNPLEGAMRIVVGLPHLVDNLPRWEMGLTSDGSLRVPEVVLSGQ